MPAPGRSGPGGACSRGVPAPGWVWSGGVPAPRGAAPGGSGLGGVPVPRGPALGGACSRWGVPALGVWSGGGACSGGCLLWGVWSGGCRLQVGLVWGVPAPRGVYLLLGGSGPGGCLVDPPSHGYCCGRYASYWNAFLFVLSLHLVTAKFLSQL